MAVGDGQLFVAGGGGCAIGWRGRRIGGPGEKDDFCEGTTNLIPGRVNAYSE